jgi:hypothetical protein
MPQPEPCTNGTTPSISGIIGEDVRAVEHLGDEFRDRGGAIHRGENADVIARAGLPIRALVAFEGRAQLRRQDFVVLGGLREAIVAREIVHDDVVFVQPVARRDLLGGKSDDWPNLRTGWSCAIFAIAILCPRGMRSRAVTPAAATPGPIWSTATTMLSSGERRIERGSVISQVPPCVAAKG